MFLLLVKAGDPETFSETRRGSASNMPRSGDASHSTPPGARRLKARGPHRPTGRVDVIRQADVVVDNAQLAGRDHFPDLGASTCWQ